MKADWQERGRDRWKVIEKVMLNGTQRGKAGEIEGARTKEMGRGQM